jgi:hypothetical protein
VVDQPSRAERLSHIGGIVPRTASLRSFTRPLSKSASGMVEAAMGTVMTVHITVSAKRSTSTGEETRQSH